MTTPVNGANANSSQARLLIADRGAERIAWLSSALEGHYEVYHTACGSTVAQRIDELRPDLLVIGPDLDDMAGVQLLADLEDGAEIDRPVLFFLVDRETSIPDDPRIYYLLSQDMSAGDLQAIFASALREQSRDEPATSFTPQQVRRMLEVPRDFARQRDLQGAGAVLIRSMTQFLGADRADCLFYSKDEGSLWSEDGRDDSARAGLAGFAARTGQLLSVACASDDPRYQSDIDDAEGVGHERILVFPIKDTAGEVHAVVVAVRDAQGEPFGKHDRAVCEWLGSKLAPLVSQLAMQVEADALEDQEAQGPQKLFRQEAALAHTLAGRRGDVVRVHPWWIGWAYWMLVLFLVAGIVFLFTAEVAVYSTGTAVISLSGRTEVNAPVSGNTLTIDVVEGQEVVAGQVLATFFAPEESSRLTQLDKEWQAGLRAYLSRRGDLSARGTVATLRTERDRLREKLTIRASKSGSIENLRVEPGQPVSEHDSLLSIVSPGGSLSVIALLPGSDRPQLRLGMPLRLTLKGYPRSHATLLIESIGNDVISPGEAQRVLGRQQADTSAITTGPVVIVRARLETSSFRYQGELYSYIHGMAGVAEVELRSESIIRTLIPGWGHE